MLLDELTIDKTSALHLREYFFLRFVRFDLRCRLGRPSPLVIDNPALPPSLLIIRASDAESIEKKSPRAGNGPPVFLYVESPALQ